MAATTSIPLNQNVFRLRVNPSKPHTLPPVESYPPPRVFCSVKPSNFQVFRQKIKPVFRFRSVN
ncbi:hypothetical protein L484_011857 [Morus notabilis]|uniref:Uncharacterized protein n=1 Tax=Morus notabilis TaxID=981085 RepID=W9S1T9_9ROSA|nr:hypothetical protein L484_011857 [Morus notabilis]